MIRVNIPELSDRDCMLLEEGLKKGESHCFRTRFHVILLKAEGRSSKDVGLITDMSHISVNHWVKLKKEWLNPEDYPEKDKLFYATNRWLAALGTHVCIKFCHFNKNLF